ncbi:hypothetical protein NDU88_000615 [Pleurodeles waltl]|uniref:Uncharacterized protein n=1 Tax=Pleurodeles waltl TaxID=8319 RepID=A0AAV7SAI9_PLEWA|nr:hypothetical protein NDU88_000615 [Pleurodeles waltl]
MAGGSALVPSDSGCSVFYPTSGFYLFPFLGGGSGPSIDCVIVPHPRVQAASRINEPRWRRGNSKAAGPAPGIGSPRQRPLSWGAPSSRTEAPCPGSPYFSPALRSPVAAHLSGSPVALRVPARLGRSLGTPPQGTAPPLGPGSPRRQSITRPRFRSQASLPCLRRHR